MVLYEHEHVVGAWAESCNGPGWSNQVVWVCLRSAWDGSHRVDCLQPKEQPPEVRALFGLFAVPSATLNHLVASEVAKLKPRPRPRPRAERKKRSA